MSRINKIIILIIMVLACIMLIPGGVQAGLQANKGGTSLDTRTASEFFDLIKTMETGTLGKNAVGAADGIDCHMAKNVEWGGAVLLTVCQEFGKAPSNTNVTSVNNSTTGNESGVYQMASNKCEYTAHYLTGATRYADSLINAVNSGKGKYVDVYQGTTSEYFIDGDALILRADRTQPTGVPILPGLQVSLSVTEEIAL